MPSRYRAREHLERQANEANPVQNTLTIQNK
jgi:hypothetical protein